MDGFLENQDCYMMKINFNVDVKTGWYRIRQMECGNIMVNMRQRETSEVASNRELS